MKIKNIVKRTLVSFYRYMAHAFPLCCSKAMFMSNMGRNYSGNVRAIFEKMKEDDRFSKYKKIWAFNGDFFASVKKMIDTLKQNIYNNIADIKKRRLLKWDLI